MHLAKYSADEFGSPAVAPEHILLALLNDGALIRNAIAGASEAELREAITAHLPRREMQPLPHDLPLNKESLEALGVAGQEAAKLNDDRIRNGHILLALVLGTGYAAELLTQKGLSIENLKRYLS